MSGFQIVCRDEAATCQLGETLALAVRCGDLITLEGDLGAGKTTLARALLRNAADDPQMEVPSPTFTLVQSYEDLSIGNFTHLDLYRLESGSELEELGVEEALGGGVVLVEWPEKADGALPQATLNITLQQGDRDEARNIGFSGTPAALDRIKRSLAIREFLDANGHRESPRYHLTGDASARAYETIRAKGGEEVILMNSPAMPDGPPIRDGLPYSKIANLAEDVRAFIGVAQSLEKQGFRAPHIHAMDIEQGILLIEDLGRGSVIDDQRKPIPQRYAAAVKTLAALHEGNWETKHCLPDGSTHTIPPFSRSAMMIEIDLLPQWYAEFQRGKRLAKRDEEQFYAIWNRLIDELEQAETSLTLRDFHSPNIIWIEEASGNDRIGLIDFQDAMIGPTAYDLASIAQDARVDVSAELETELLDHYCASRTQLDETSLRSAYAIMAAQRATKLLGIFVRLSKRDGKHAYLAHLPRIENYLARSLAHPTLDEYRSWVETVLKK